MKKQLIVPVVLVIVAISAVLGLKFLRANKTTGQHKGPSVPVSILYYGNTCPHCQKVEAYIKESQLPAGYQLEQKEVWDNQVNAEELLGRAKACGITQEIGVPFLYAQDGECLGGDQPIIDYFKALKK
jgi:glutaredoxin